MKVYNINSNFSLQKTSCSRIYIKASDSARDVKEQALALFSDGATTVMFLASASAIEIATKAALNTKQNFVNGLHQTTSVKMHITDKGEPLQRENAVDKDTLPSMLGVTKASELTCYESL